MLPESHGFSKRFSVRYRRPKRSAETSLGRLGEESKQAILRLGFWGKWWWLWGKGEG